jgi:hypothetical protein
MIAPDDDRELRERFERLRREDEPSQRPFGAVIAGATLRAPGRAVRRARLLRVATAMVAILVAVVVLVIVESRVALERRERWSLRLDPDSVTWEGPTHFLLDTPGRGLMRTIPVLEFPHGAGPAAPRRLPRDTGARS